MLRGSWALRTCATRSPSDLTGGRASERPFWCEQAASRPRSEREKG
jgi:hypothetical protein